VSLAPLVTGGLPAPFSVTDRNSAQPANGFSQGLIRVQRVEDDAGAAGAAEVVGRSGVLTVSNGAMRRTELFSPAALWRGHSLAGGRSA